MPRYFVCLAALLVAAGCGGGGSSTSKTTGNSGGGVSPPNAATAVTVVTGQTTTGADITVSTPAATPQENAQDLGVNPVCNGGSAFNVGDIIHRGANSHILIFGDGLTSNMTASVNGPSDVQLSVVSGVKATDGTPGLCINAVVSGSAALGARTVVLTSPNGDITTFTGGLEVQP